MSSALLERPSFGPMLQPQLSGNSRRSSLTNARPSAGAVLGRLGSLVGLAPTTQEGPVAPLRKIKTLQENLAVLRFAALVTISPIRARALQVFKRFLQPEDYEIVSRYATTMHASSFTSAAALAVSAITKGDVC